MLLLVKEKVDMEHTDWSWCWSLFEERDWIETRREHILVHHRVTFLTVSKPKDDEALTSSLLLSGLERDASLVPMPPPRGST